MSKMCRFMNAGSVRPCGAHRAGAVGEDEYPGAGRLQQRQQRLEIFGDRRSGGAASARLRRRSSDSDSSRAATCACRAVTRLCSAIWALRLIDSCSTSATARVIRKRMISMVMRFRSTRSEIVTDGQRAVANGRLSPRSLKNNSPSCVLVTIHPRVRVGSLAAPLAARVQPSPNRRLLISYAERFVQRVVNARCCDFPATIAGSGRRSRRCPGTGRAFRGSTSAPRSASRRRFGSSTL